jgi:phosphatidylinositol dimannoside acyltransferase
MGNGVAMATHLARHGYPVSVIYRESGKIAEGFFRDGINALGLEAIPAVPAAVGVRRMLKALKANRVVFILMDQAAKNQGVLTPFLGKPMHMPPGPAELARRTGASVVPALLEGVQPQWRFRMGESWQAAEGQSLEEQVAILTQIMQQHIEKQPQWWTWHQRRWVRHDFS